MSLKNGLCARVPLKCMQVIIILFSVMVKGITRVFSVNMPASRVHLSRHGETDNVIIAESGAPALFVLKTGFWG